MADDFLGSVLPALREADTAFHNGNAGPRTGNGGSGAPSSTSYVTCFSRLHTAGARPAGRPGSPRSPRRRRTRS